MSSLENLVQVQPDKLINRGDVGDHVKAVQLALSQAGYRVGDDGVFGPGTQSAVQRFQAQHGLPADGKVGVKTAQVLDLPHAALVADAIPRVAVAGGHTWPHDDTASLTAFYDKPWLNDKLLTLVPVPWVMSYIDDHGSVFPVHNIRFNVKAADALSEALRAIWEFYGRDQKQIEMWGLHNFGGSYNYRPVRGSSRLSTHAFGASIDLDPGHNPLIPVGAPNKYTMPPAAVNAFKATGAFWGGDYKGRKDPMHFQYAHED